MRSASGSPTPKTTCVRPAASRQRSHAAFSPAYVASASRRVSASAAAATAPAATAPSAEAGLPGGAVSREHRQLPSHPYRAAVGARAVGIVHADELLAMA